MELEPWPQFRSGTANKPICWETQQPNDEQFKTQTAPKTVVILAGFCIQQSLIFVNSELWLQLGFWVLIVSQEVLYVKYAVLGVLSPPGLRFAIWAIFVESLWNNAKNGALSQQLNKYCSDCKLENGGWKSIQNCMMYIYIILWDDQNSNTQ